MSRTIFLDIEEAIAREVRRITSQDFRTIDKIAFKTTYDPFTGEEVQRPIEPSFYDSSADAAAIHYPHFFIKLLRSREDRFSGREIPLYGRYWITNKIYGPKTYEVITQASDGFINAVGNTLTTGILKIALVLPGQLIRILNGNNKGTYIVDSVVKDALGNHQINVSDVLVNTLPAFQFDPTTRVAFFAQAVDLSTIKVGDQFIDADSTVFSILSVEPDNGKIELDGIDLPNVSEGASITRLGDIFTQVDTTALSFLIMDPNKPVSKLGQDCGIGSAANVAANPEVPLDAYYLIRIDSKTKQNHTMILNRMWEEFNPPRTALPVIRRSAISARSDVMADLSIGDSVVSVKNEDWANFNLGDKIYIYDDLSPSKRSDGDGFERPFEAKIISKPALGQLELDTPLDKEFLLTRCPKLVSNADFFMYMFHFVDHVTKDVDGAQYWVHEFTFWVQFWIERQGTGKEITTVTDVGFTLEDNDPDVDVDDQYVYDDIESF
jgi:hypothetical protein